MEKTNLSYSKKPSKIFFANHVWFRHFFNSLSLGEVIQLACLNKEAFHSISLFFKERLSNEGIDVEKRGPDYLKLYKDVHLKSVIIMPLNALNCKDKVDCFAAAKISKKTLFVDKIIRDFYFGIKFVGYDFGKKGLMLITKLDYMGLNKQTLAKEAYQRLIPNLTKWNLESRHAVYLDAEDNLKTLIFMKNKNIHEMEERVLDTKIGDFVLNYNYLAFISKANHDIFLWSKFSAINLGQAVKFKISMPIDNYQMILSGLNFYVRDSSDKYHYLSLHNLDPITVDGNTAIKNLTMSEFTFLDGKRIKRIFPGLRNEIVETSEDYKSSDNWTNEEVRDWFKDIGINSIDSILKYEKFTGDQLCKVDKDYMVDRFGIKNTDVHNKISSEIELVKGKSHSEPELYGIGYNMEGQLVLNNGHKNVTHPTKLKLPELANTDFIKDILFGWTNTLIVTNEGRLFLSYKKMKSKLADEEGAMEEEKVIQKTGRPPKKPSRHFTPDNDSPDEPSLPKKRKNSSRRLEVELDHDDESAESEEEDDRGNRKGNRRKKSASGLPPKSTASRGIRKDKKKVSGQTSEAKKDEDEGVARWMEITNLFSINK